jgi:4-hydroxy-4-methyl-2-oxoglutarate aldolase
MKRQDVALTINRAFTRPSEALIREFMGIPTGNVCDAQGRVGALDYRIKPVTTMAAFTGVALTVDAGPRDNLAPWAALEIAEAGDVIVIATREHLACSVIGDVYVGMAKNAGIKAIVTDGVVRDVAGLNAVGIPVFAMGVSPNSPWKNGPGNIGLSVVVGGVTMNTGDIVVGDSDGVVRVPHQHAPEVAKELKAVRAKEEGMEADVEAGHVVPGWLAEAKEKRGVRYLD